MRYYIRIGISRSSVSELYQLKVRQRAMFMRLTMVRNVYDGVPVEHELIISVGVNTFKTKGIVVFAPREYISVLEPKLFIMCKTFSL